MNTNSFGNLKEVIVGVESNFTRRQFDFTFKYFYQENLNQEIYDKKLCTITKELMDIRNEQLDGLAKILENLGIKVSRPEQFTKPETFKLPYDKYEGVVSPANNVRDLTWVFQNTILETPVFVRDRLYENLAMETIFKDTQDIHKYKRLSLGQYKLTEDTLDLSAWTIDRKFNEFQRRFKPEITKFIPAIDGAQFLRLSKYEVLVNISTWNHFHALKLIERIFPETEFIPIKVTDNHIDGSIVQLDNETLMINPTQVEVITEELKRVDLYRRFKIIIPKLSTRKEIYQEKITGPISPIASINGMDLNILSISPKTLVTKHNANEVNEALCKNGFNVVPVVLDNCEIFGGGIHCSTLDLRREDA